MDSNCSLHPVDPIDPSVDPAYRDGIPPRPRRPPATGAVRTDWPVARIPPSLDRLHTISIEALEDALERAACAEETG
jgi:hypothetical protein